MPSSCSVPGCDHPRRNNISPYCEMHYTRVKRHGSPHVVLKDHRPFADRWRDHIEMVDGCWIWTSGTSNGYGITSEGYGNVFAVHRRVYCLLVGEIPDGLELDHLCRNRACCNPDHLEPVPHPENVRRGEAGINNRAKTHCANGHEFTPENMYPSPRGRRCKTCTREANRESQRRKRGTPTDAVANADKTHCPQGHEYTPANTYTSAKGSRVCRQCNNEAQRRYRERKRTEAASL